MSSSATESIGQSLSGKPACAPKRGGVIAGRRGGAAAHKLPEAQPGKPNAGRRPGANRQRMRRAPRPLATYSAADGRPRELILRQRPDGERLLIDRDAGSGGDPRLVGLLASDEPPANGGLLCRLYLADPTRGRCRLLKRADLEAQGHSAPLAPQVDRAVAEPEPPAASWCFGACGRYWAIAIFGEGPAAQARWYETREPAARCNLAAPPDSGALSLRQVLGAVQSYQPALAITEAAIRTLGRTDERRSAQLRCELERTLRTPLLLNRALREAVVAAIAADRLNLNEIALRCGRVKRDQRGRESGATSWLTRRLGLAPEGPAGHLSHWIHSDLLALIARSGLGIDPREVELTMS